MSTSLADPVEMIRRGAPHLIRSDEELVVYTEALFSLTKNTDPTADEEEAIALLTLLVDRYETERYPVPDAEPVEILRFLVEHNGLAERDLAPEIGNASAIALAFSGKRQLSRDQILRLSERFRVAPSVFFPKL